MQKPHFRAAVIVSSVGMAVFSRRKSSNEAAAASLMGASRAGGMNFGVLGWKALIPEAAKAKRTTRVWRIFISSRYGPL